MGEQRWYDPPVEQLLTLGDPREAETFGSSVSWADYPAMGLSGADVPELIRMAADRRLHTALGTEPSVWAPLHAWRALGQLRAVAAVDSLLKVLNSCAEGEEDWGIEEIPTVLGMIGPPAVDRVAAFLGDASYGLYARAAAARGLEEIASRFPECRDTCVDHLTQQLAKAPENDPALNGFIVGNMLGLGAEEAADTIERAYAGGSVDESVAGGWEDVKNELGVESVGYAVKRPPVDQQAKLHLVEGNGRVRQHVRSERERKREARRRERKARRQSRKRR